MKNGLNVMLAISPKRPEPYSTFKLEQEAFRQLSVVAPRVTDWYRVSHLVANLGWVELNLGSSLGWLAIQWVATAQAGWWNILNPCQQNPVRD